MNARIYDSSKGEHEATLLEVSSGDPSQVSIPEGCYSFLITSLAEATVEIDHGFGNVDRLVLRSQPLTQSSVFFVKERVQILGVEELQRRYSKEEIGPLLDRMELMETKVCMVLPGNVFMPITAEVNLLEIENKA